MRKIAVDSLVLFAVTIILVIYIVRGITKPVVGMTDVMQALAKGNTETEIWGRNLKSEIDGAVTPVAEIVAEIAAASRDQTVGIGEINTAISQMDEMTQENSALVEQSTAATQAMEAQVEKLSKSIATFSVGGDSNDYLEASRPAPTPPQARPGPARKPAARHAPQAGGAKDEGWEKF